MTAPRTLYDILGVAEDLPQETLAAELERQWQKYVGDGEMRPLLTLCRQSLGTEETRSAYDRQLRLQRARRQRDENSRATAETPRPGISRLALALLLPLAGFGLWKYGLPQFASAPQPAHPASPVAPVSAPSPQNPTQATAPANAPASTTVVETSAPANPVVAPNVSPQWQRPAKKPGFDAQYLAWSVFTIRQSRSSGSGVLIAPDKILTNCHVLAGAATNGMVVIHSLTRKVTPVEKYARLDDEDACLVFAPNAGGEPVEWGSAANLRLSDPLHSFGHPGGSADIVWSEGQLLARVEKNGDEFLISNNYCRPGSSGGPLLDDNGRLVGIVTAVQRYTSRTGEAPRYGACISLGESVAKALLARPLFPIALAPAQFLPGR